jgi:hypothetical protein
MSYRVFTRTWWKANPAWPGGREPSIGRRYTLAIVETEDRARALCAAYKERNKPGLLSRKAEYEEVQP